MNMDKGQDTVEMLSLEEYEKMGIKLINKHITSSGLRKEMLSSEDVISDLIHILAKADLKFDGRGSREGYRSACAQYFFRHYITKKANHSKKNKNYNPKIHSENSYTLFDLIPSKENTIKQMEDQETIAFIFAQIPQSWQEILSARHIEGKTLQEIADARGITKSRVGQIIEKAEKECKLLSN